MVLLRRDIANYQHFVMVASPGSTAPSGRAFLKVCGMLLASYM
jgi:hypothetical protein